MPAIPAPTRSSITCGRSGARKSTRPQLGKLKITCRGSFAYASRAARRRWALTTVPAPLRRIRALIRLRRLLQRRKPLRRRRPAHKLTGRNAAGSTGHRRHPLHSRHQA